MDQEPKYRKTNFSSIPIAGYKILLFFIEVFILLACIQYTQVLYNNDILPDKMVQESFSQTSCQIISKTLAEKGHLVHRYRADFVVSYSVNNKPYQALVTGNGLDQAYFHERQPQEDALEQFTVGNSYTCWYNPQIPQIAVLVLRHDWASTLPLAVPTVIGLISAYYILKGVFEFLGLLFVRSREIRRDKKNQYRR